MVPSTASLRADSQVCPTPRRVQDGPRNRTFEWEVETHGPGSYIGRSADRTPRRNVVAQASEARRSAKRIRTNHRLRRPSAFSGQGGYSVPMVPGSGGSAGPGVSRSSSGWRSVSPGCPVLRSSRSTRAIRSWSCSSEASRSCWSESNCRSSGSKFSPSLRFLRQSTRSPECAEEVISEVGDVGSSSALTPGPRY